jgi:prolyl-tRNA synthetase
VVLPWGKTLQTAVAYEQGQLFSRAFEVRSRCGNEWKYVYQTTCGLSEKTIIAALLVHSDQVGLRIPPAFAPYQVVFLAVCSDDSRAAICAIAERLSRELSLRGIRTLLEPDSLSHNAFLRWTVRGAPLQVIVSDETLRNDQVEVIDRSTLVRSVLTTAHLIEAIPALLESVAATLLRDQERSVQELPIGIRMEEIDATGGPINVWLCKKEECLRTLENDRPGEVIGYLPVEERGVCVACAKQGAFFAVFARRI